MGDLNGDLRSSLKDKGTKEPNDRGLLSCDFANFFNLSPVNLLSTCNGPLESYFSHCGRYRSPIDYILLPLCLESKIIESKTFELDFDNTSDHQPLFLELEYPKEKLSSKQPTSSPLLSTKFVGRVSRRRLSTTSMSFRYSHQSLFLILTNFATSILLLMLLTNCC